MPWSVLHGTCQQLSNEQKNCLGMLCTASKCFQDLAYIGEGGGSSYDNLYHVLCNRAAETSQCDLEAASEDGLASFWEPFPRYGTAYLYDADRLARRIGPEIARELKSVQHLLSSMRCQLPSPTPSTPWLTPGHFLAEVCRNLAAFRPCTFYLGSNVRT